MMAITINAWSVLTEHSRGTVAVVSIKSSASNPGPILRLEAGLDPD